MDVTAFSISVAEKAHEHAVADGRDVDAAYWCGVYAALTNPELAVNRMGEPVAEFMGKLRGPGTSPGR